MLVSEVDVGDLDIACNLQLVNVTEGHAMEEVKQVLPVHKHLEPLVPTANRHLRRRSQSSQSWGNTLKPTKTKLPAGHLLRQSTVPP